MILKLVVNVNQNVSKVGFKNYFFLLLIQKIEIHA
jgi:hypothetical protein